MSGFGEFLYVEKPDALGRADAYIATLPRLISGKRDLLEALARSLGLPGYFGFNWDALFECLCNFDWINEKRIILIHQDLPLLPRDEMGIYIKILSDAVSDWALGERRFEVVFNLSDKKTIQGIISDL